MFLTTASLSRQPISTERCNSIWVSTISPRKKGWIFETWKISHCFQHVCRPRFKKATPVGSCSAVPAHEIDCRSAWSGPAGVETAHLCFLDSTCRVPPWSIRQSMGYSYERKIIQLHPEAWRYQSAPRLSFRFLATEFNVTQVYSIGARHPHFF